MCCAVQLEDEDLELSLGITHKLQRRKILDEIVRLREKSMYSTVLYPRSALQYMLAASLEYGLDAPDAGTGAAAEDYFAVMDKDRLLASVLFCILFFDIKPFKCNTFSADC